MKDKIGRELKEGQWVLVPMINRLYFGKIIEFTNSEDDCQVRVKVVDDALAKLEAVQYCAWPERLFIVDVDLVPANFYKVVK